MIRRTSVRQLFHSQRTAGACSWPSRCVRSYNGSVSLLPNPELVEAYCTISGRIGDRKTAGRGCVSLEGFPSPPMIVTVGRLVILAVISFC